MLFDESSISTPKAVAAKIAIDLMTATLGITNITIYPQVIRIDIHNIKKLFSTAECIIGAVDSIKTRKLIDKYIVWHQETYFDAGLSGLKVIYSVLSQTKRRHSQISMILIIQQMK